MLTEAKNRLLTRIGPGTPMGDLLRRYWHPVGAVDELERDPIKPVRLMGEDLVLYRDLGGTYGLIDRHCPHRRADLAYGYVEQCGLRCNYHGWLYAEDGACIEQPFEEIMEPGGKLKARIRVKAYPVQAMAGLLWAYLGPQPAPALPNWEPFSWKNGFAQIVFADVPCNWLQCQENSIDPVHFEWAHSNWSVRLSGNTGPYAPTHVKLDFEEFDHGFVYKRVREDTDEAHPLWTVGRVCLWPNGFFLGDHIEWRVPVDDENTLSVTWAFMRVPKGREPYAQAEVPSWRSPIRDPRTGRWITSHVINQDIVAWVGQGTIADRTQENLGASDRGVAMLRRRFLDDLDAIARGEDPKGILRDAGAAQCVALPIAGRKLFSEGLALEELARHPILARHLADFPFHCGQPEAVRRAYRQAMGVTDELLAALAARGVAAKAE
jgi:5,5'-dehydrodivanillate O-demethylase